MLERTFGWIEQHASVLSVLIVGAISLAAVIGVTVEQSRSKQVDREQFEHLCETVAANRQVVVGLIEVVLDDSNNEVVPPLLRARLEEFQRTVNEVPQPNGCL